MEAGVEAGVEAADAEAAGAGGAPVVTAEMLAEETKLKEASDRELAAMAQKVRASPRASPRARSSSPPPPPPPPL